MTITAPHPAPTEPQDDLRAEDALYYRRVLHGLIDQGADLARIVHGQAAAQADPESQADAGAAPLSLPDAAAAFDRLSRAVRRTVAMARHVARLCPRARAPGRGGRQPAVASCATWRT